MIPIVMSADENYAMPMCVAVHSILLNRTSDVHYCFYLLVPGAFSEAVSSKFDALAQMHQNFTISFVEMGDAFSMANIHIEHISVPTFYRLLAPDLLSQYDRCLYFDVDTVICCDLSELYNIDIGENYLAGVRSPHFCTLSGKRRDDYLKTIGIDSLESYINDGVLVMNLQKMRDDGLTQKYLELAENNALPGQSQLLNNVVCYGKIKLLEFRYNVQTKYWFYQDGILTERRALKAFSPYELRTAIAFPYVIHFADHEKPWNYLNGFLYQEWWRYALSSPFAEDAWRGLISALTRYSKSEEKRLKTELRIIRKSRAYRLGRFILYVPHNVNRGIQCLRDNGLKYTVKRIFQKLRGID